MRILKILVVSLVVLFFIMSPLASVTHAATAFNANLIMDDVVFNDYNSMSAGQIDSWLNANFPTSCISTNRGFSAPDVTGYLPTGPDSTGGYYYGADVSAGTVISHAAQVYGLNPEVILATLEKEEGLVSGSGYPGNPACSNLRYSAAMGYLCTDSVSPHDYSGFELYSINGTPVTSVSGTCVEATSVVGFSRQVLLATWQLKFDQQRSEGNIGWDVQRTNYPTPGSIWTTQMTHKHVIAIK